MSNNNDDRATAMVVRVDPTELDLPAGPTDNLEEIAEALATVATKRCNLLAPVTRIDYLPPDHVLVFKILAFDTRRLGDSKVTSNGTFYKNKGGKWALHRTALDMLASAAAVRTAHSDWDLLEWSHWKATHTIEWKGLDGKMQRVTRTKEIDLRNGSELMKSMSDGQLSGARIHGAANAETKAFNRCIRAAFGMEGGYSKEDAALPFVLPTLIWAPDLDDPVIKRMMAAKELGITAEVFGAEEAARVRARGNRADVVDAADPPRQLADKGNLDELDLVGLDDDKERVPAKQRKQEERPKERAFDPLQCEADDDGQPCDERVTQAEANASLDSHGVVHCKRHRARR